MSFRDTELGKLPCEWEVNTMENSLSEIIDYRGKTPEKSESGIVTLSAKSVKNGYIDYTSAYYISEETYKKFMVRGFPKKGDILLTTEAPLGYVAKLDRDKVAIAQRLLTLRGKEGYLDNDYLRYYLMSSNGQYQLKSRETGTTVTGIKQSEFRKAIIAIPPIEEQKAISSVLSSLDEKIEVNNQINKTLEAMAQALFKHWFVDFEFPNEDGEPYKSSVGELVESELGMIPKGWRVHRNSEVFKLLYGKALKAEDRCTGLYPVYGSNGIVGYHNEALVKGPGIVIGRKGNPGTVNFVWDDFYPIDTTFYVDSKVSKIYLYYALKVQNLDKLGTDSAVPGLNRNIAYMNLILVPNEDNLKCFDETILPILNYIKCKESENNQLLALRDTLLPKLMSGEIRVPIDQEGEI